MTQAQHPKIAPQAPEEWPDDVRTILTASQGEEPTPKGHWNIFTTLARNRALMVALMPLADYVFTDSQLSFEDRELLILRTGFNCRSSYVLAHHLRIATVGGLSRATVARVTEGPDAPGWSDRQRLVLLAADELHVQSSLSDALWARLADHLDDARLIELTIIAGFYHAICYLLNSAGVEVEPELERLEPPPRVNAG